MTLRFIASFRLLRVGLHLAHGLVVAGLVYPWLGRPARLRLKQRWSRQLLAMLGVRLEIVGAPACAPLRVANHISWLDVFVINAVEPAAFVAKDDVARWPVVGRLARLTETVFMARGNGRASRAAAESVAAALRAGRVVAAFPEGTTTAGEGVLPFRSALFQAAVDAGAAIQPLALRYLDAAGRRSTAAAYCGDTSLPASLWRLASTPQVRARAIFLPPIAAQTRERRALAAYCEFMVASALALDVEPRLSIERRDQGFLGETASPVGGDMLPQRLDEAVVNALPIEMRDRRRGLAAYP